MYGLDIVFKDYNLTMDALFKDYNQHMIHVIFCVSEVAIEYGRW